MTQLTGYNRFTRRNRHRAGLQSPATRASCRFVQMARLTKRESTSALFKHRPPRRGQVSPASRLARVRLSGRYRIPPCSLYSDGGVSIVGSPLSSVESNSSTPVNSAVPPVGRHALPARSDSNGKGCRRVEFHPWNKRRRRESTVAESR